MCELWRKLNSKEEEILILREKIRDLERNQVPLDLTQTVSYFIIINCHLFNIVQTRPRTVYNCFIAVVNVHQSCGLFTFSYDTRDKKLNLFSFIIKLF